MKGIRKKVWPMSRLRRSAAVAVLLLLPFGCAKSGPASTRDVVAAPDAIESAIPHDPPSPITFEEVTASWGIQFTQQSGNSPEKHFPAANGSGVATGDFDADGWMDLYFLTARPLPFHRGSLGPVNKFFRNRGSKFEDVTGPSGLEISLFCHGVAHGDLNNDGFSDLVLTTYGGTRVYGNHGDGTFAEMLSFRDDRWGSSAGLGDFDEDGSLDIYVTHYGRWSIETNEKCGDTEKQIRTFCSPKRIPPAVHALYKNLGDGEFADVTSEAGIARSDGRGQGVVVADIDIDGHLDLYVANDLCPNFLFLGNGDGTFRDVTDYCGAAFSRDGLPQAGMGVDCADVDRDGRPDLYVTNFRHEYNALYMNLGQATFVDKSHAAGVAGDSMDEVGWGTRLADLDNDGWLDIFVTNGHVDDNISEIDPRATYAEPPKVWRNVDGRFRYLGASVGPYFAKRHVGRGASFGDLDNDGRLDIAVNHVDGPATVLRNTSPVPGDSPTPWVRLTLVGRGSNRDAIGARVTVSRAAESVPIVRQRTSGASYLSDHDPRILIGLGDLVEITDLSVEWPSGEVTKLHDVSPGQSLLVRER